MTGERRGDSMNRRRFGIRAFEILVVSLVAGCGRLSSSPWFTRLLGTAESATRAAHSLLTPRRALAQEFSEAERSPVFPTNGTTNPEDPVYQAHVQRGFADWRLEVGGLVERASAFSLAELRLLPSRTQITRHDCVEGWSAIAKWKGVKLEALLGRVGVRPDARYVVFHCADPMDDGIRYYESIDLEEARHAQTILAYEINDRVLPVEHGAPLRLRVERQLGYKMAKYVMRIELVSSVSAMGDGLGGYWEDRGYEWYAGI
jgi:DMSO/TMAO reductase YedYZ molybdopterin-dependent catalytic subunit